MHRNTRQSGKYWRDIRYVVRIQLIRGGGMSTKRNLPSEPSPRKFCLNIEKPTFN